MNNIYQRIALGLSGVIKKKFDIELEPPLWELPAVQEFGDISSSTAMRLAGILKRNPVELAEIIKIDLLEKLKKDIEKIEILKPAFINIFFSREVMIESLNSIVVDGQDFFRPQIAGKKILMEYVSGNPTGPLSIAHGRQAVVGSTIANILKFLGNEVDSEYYVNDAGRQLDMLVLSVKAWIDTPAGEQASIPQDGYRGEYVKDIACAVSNDPDYRQNPQKFNLKQYILEYVLIWIKKDLTLAGVDFDFWRSQQALIDQKFIDNSIDELRKRGFIFDKDGAVWVETTKFGDDKDRVIVKADGELTYFASDIAYHQEKWRRGYDQLINLWGPDHHGYIPRVKAVLKALGCEKDILNVIIIQLVTLKSKEKMSKRMGTAVLLSDLINDAGKDAARFYYLTRKNSSHLEFDLDLAKENSFNNPLYYIQYSCARIESVLAKTGGLNPQVSHNQHITQEADLALLRQILRFFYCLEKVKYSLEPVNILEYLKNLAAEFHKFYETQRILGIDSNIACARLNLLKAARIVLHCGLNLLGITPARKM